MVKKLVILVVLSLFVVTALGCGATADRSVRRNMSYMKDDTWRFVGLDQPSGLHARDTEPSDAYEPYRGYE
jgi:hypothetical protein